MKNKIMGIGMIALGAFTLIIDGDGTFFTFISIFGICKMFERGVKR